MKSPIAVVLSVVLVAGAVAVNRLGAQTETPATPAPATIQSVVEITRAVPAGSAAVDAFTVPAGLTLVVTDIIVTNTGTTAAGGGAVSRAGASTPTPPLTTTPPATSPTGVSSGATTVSGTVTQTDSTVTGPLCVPAQSTTVLPLTTGIEFGSGQVVQLLNAPPAAAASAPASLAFHLRGLLVPVA
jgi:hypothetical protein